MASGISWREEIIDGIIWEKQKNVGCKEKEAAGSTINPLDASVTRSLKQCPCYAVKISEMPFIDIQSFNDYA